VANATQVSPYNNSDTKFNKMENTTKSAKEHNAPGLPRCEATQVGGFMRRIDAGYVAAAFIAILAALAPVQSRAEATLTPAERCARLSRQVDKAINAHPPGTRVNAARALHKRGDHLCAHKKRAQGIRALAKALKQLGAKPVDID
jgi:hypothetical protein